MYDSIIILGPTASGKTSLSIDLAKELKTEIVNADSMYIYIGLDIGTAKPTIEEREGIPHYMIDIVEPEYDFSVADFKDRAKVLIDEITAQGKVPIVAGGTGLYFRILLENFELPKIECNPNLRTELEKISNEELYNELKQKDPVYAEKVHPNNKVRLVRVLEVISSCLIEYLILFILSFILFSPIY